MSAGSERESPASLPGASSSGRSRARLAGGRALLASNQALPWLLLLPACLFAAPFSPLTDDPYPHLAGTGWTACLSLPLALVLLVGGARTAAVWPFSLLFLWALCISRPLGPVTDTFEARRALLVLALVPLFFAGGATLGARERSAFAFLLVLLSCLWTGWALVSGLTGLGSGSLAGVLGDTGSLSQAALPGAAIGAVWLARESGARRAAGALALVSFLVHVAVAPVLAGSHSLLAALGLGALLGGPRGRGRLGALALAALLAPLVGLAVKQWRAEEAPPSASAVPAPAVSTHELAGLGVRGRIALAALALVGDHPLLGVGPGQFQAAFPPYRDPGEIELSRHGVCSELDTEVEHAHDDWLQAFCELGIPGGLLLALGLVLVAGRALRELRSDERTALATAALALLVNALVHSPLLANSASSSIGLALFGAVSARDAREQSRVTGLVVAVPALLAAACAGPLVRHGRALCEYVRSIRESSSLAQAPDGALALMRFQEAFGRAAAAVDEALAAAPTSAPARVLGSQVDLKRWPVHAQEGSGGSRPTAEVDWDDVLEVRPHSVQAWEQSATNHARSGAVEEARARYGRALALSPSHPRIIENAARLECTIGDLERGLRHIEQLRSQGCLDPQWLESLGNERVLQFGAPTRAARLFFEKELRELVPEELHARSREPERAPVSADALECLAQLLWARDHVAHGAFELAVRNYRQAYDRSRIHREGGAALYRLELAAAEARTGRVDEAREHAQAPSNATGAPGTPGAPGSASGAEELSDWARDALRELGIADPGGRP